MKEMRVLVLCLVALAVVLLPAAAAAAELARVDVGAAQVTWTPSGEHNVLVLTVSRPDESTVRQEFVGKAPVYQLAAEDPDGAYRWELRAVPAVSAEVQKELEAARKSGDPSALWRLRRDGKLPEGLVQSGGFTVERGVIVPQDRVEEKGAASSKPSPRKSQVGQDKELGVIFEADQVIPDDLIVQGSGCFGFDCVNNESFGFDTIRLKENNLRIKFEDTSAGTFPSTDWQLTANDSASGGQNKFSIEDITAARVPFTVEGGATTNSIYVDSTGRVGFRTATPVLDIHVSTSNTPGIRLEQNNSGGFTAQTWDIAGNEANFFVRDVTGGSRLPFRIRPGAPTSSIDISADGDVGIGTASPDAKLNVESSGSGGTDGKVLIQNTSATTAGREMLEIKNNGQVLFFLQDTSVAGPRWANGTFATSYIIDNQATGATEMSLDQNGNVVFAGTVTPNSSRTRKQDFTTIEPREVLQKVAALPITTWSYKQESVRHIGPMAEDFFAAFSVGANDKGISVTDSAGVTLAAIQGLNQVVEEKDKEIADLKSRLEALEKMVQSLAQNKATAEQ